MKLKDLFIYVVLINLAFWVNFLAFALIPPLWAGGLGALAALFWCIMVHNAQKLPDTVHETRRKSMDLSL